MVRDIFTGGKRTFFSQEDARDFRRRIYARNGEAMLASSSVLEWHSQELCKLPDPRRNSAKSQLSASWLDISCLQEPIAFGLVERRTSRNKYNLMKFVICPCVTCICSRACPDILMAFLPHSHAQASTMHYDHVCSRAFVRQQF